MALTGYDGKHGVAWDEILPSLAAKPTIVFVHGAFTDASTWDTVAQRIRGHCPYLVAANPLQGLETDTESLIALLRTIKGDIILVGHSYGGALITNAACEVDSVKALVYVAGLAPDEGESFDDLTTRFPGSEIKESLVALKLPSGGAQLLVRPERFHAVMANDLCLADAAEMAMRQRPAAPGVFSAGARQPAWRTRPSWFVYGDEDRCVPAELHAFMARRAGAVDSLVVKGGSHSLPVSHPEAVARIVEAASMAETFEVPNLDP